MAKRKPRMYHSPSDQYWGFRTSVFSDSILKKERLSLFVNRDHELTELSEYIDERLIGVIGANGVGKSSFLRSFENQVKDDIYVVFCVLKNLDEGFIFREVLRSILIADQKDSIIFRKGFVLKTKHELNRLESEFTNKFSSESGLSTAIVRKDISGTSHVYEKHTEDSAANVLIDLFENTEDTLLIIIDDFDRIKFLSSKGEYLNFVSSFTKIVDEVFNNQKVRFVLTLGQMFKELIKEEKGEFTFSFNGFILLNDFQPESLLDLLKLRLNEIGLEFKDFMDVDSFWKLFLVSNGHPRKALRIIKEALIWVTKKNAKKFINVNIIDIIIHSMALIVDEKDFIIIQSLREFGPASSSDNDFLKVTGISQEGTRHRLVDLATKGYLIVDENTATRKKLYRLPDLSY